MYPNLLSALVNDEILAERQRQSKAARLSRALRPPRSEEKGFAGWYSERLSSLVESVRLRLAPAPQVPLICTCQGISCPAGAGGCQP